MFSIIMLNKAILGGIIITIVIITAIGLFVGLGELGKIDIEQSPNQEPYIPKKITIELSDGINMGEAGP